MSVRRRDSRLEMVDTHGVLRVWQDVSGHRTESGDYVVISGQARSKGEHLTMYLATSEPPVQVRVLDSRPTMLNGSVCHQLRLQPLPDGAPGTPDTTRDGGLETK
jgi:hypothetical protein